MPPFASTAEARIEDQKALSSAAHAAEESTSLDSEQFSVADPHEDSLDQQIRFKPWAETRRWLLTHLWRLVPSGSTRLRIRECGSNAWVDYSPSRHRVRVRSRSCGHRLCPACRARAASKLAKRMELLTQGAPTHSLKLITLTLKHSKRPLAEQIKSLQAGFRKLRSRACWRRAAATGVAIVEVTRSHATPAARKESGDWHPHLHVLARCSFIPHEQLKTAWWQVTHSSNIVDIRAIRGGAAVARYVTSYLTKPPSQQVLDSDELSQQWAAALQALHWVIPFGKRGSLPKLPADEQPNDWQPVGRLCELVARGVPWASPDFALSVLVDSLNDMVVAFVDGHDPPLQL